MKKVAIIYRTRDNQEAINYLKNTLESIFENYIYVENYYLTDLANDTKIIADAYILSHQKILYPLKEHIINFNNIIIMYRSLNKTSLSEVSKIPKDSNVLVVNDTYESSVQTLCALYESGMSHINLVPFDPDDSDNPIYKNFKVCITQDEMHLVPNHINQVINIGYREISFNTLLSLMMRLNLNFEFTNRNLVRHIRSLAEPDIYIYNNYLNNFVKNHVFNSVINDSPSALIVTNEKYDLLFSNNKAKVLFDIQDGIQDGNLLPNIMGSEIFEKIQAEIMPKSGIVINEIQYFIDKNPIMLMDEIMGYYIVFQNEKDLIDIEINARKLIEKKGLFAKYNFSDIIHESPLMKESINTAKTVALTDHTVLITGESGTGKELIAQSIHNYSKRRNMSFVAMNCAALPESLLESELFGYESGAFTGAKKNGKLGLFEQANGGTIFLDEIGDISPNLQSRLLRVLQERQIMRIGSDRVMKINTRIIAATNKDLLKEVERGNFRKDLFYRLNVITINIEPLRNRREDILPLISTFLGPKFDQLTSSDKKLLYEYEWPGNVRELESAAIHFNTLSKLPTYILNAPDIVPVETKSSVQNIDIETEILKIIMENTHPCRGIGRMQLNIYLKSMDIHIGDAKLRNILRELQNKNLISVGKGRTGTRISELGILELNKN